MDIELVLLVVLNDFFLAGIAYYMGRREAVATKVWAEQHLKNAITSDAIAKILKSPDTADKEHRTPLEQIRESVRDGVNGSIGNMLQRIKDDMTEEMKKAAEANPQMMMFSFFRDMVAPPRRRSRRKSEDDSDDD